MCGIFGIVFKHVGAAVSAETVEHCADALAHRGPDAKGIYINGSVAFAHRRLSIIDLSPRANQPFRDSASGVVITYNGEIYNYRELKYDLAQLGHGFSTESDTEVLLKAYLAWGKSCLSRLDGIFAFALFDPRSSSVLIARDRLGVKPLYYTDNDTGFVFASQPNALICWPGITRKPDLVGALSFLSYRAVVGSRTLFAGISKLEPGSLLEIRRGGISANVGGAFQRTWGVQGRVRQR
ncbi:asparagine synthetase B family protein [Sinorhizobium psoraleae]|uniref:asparagine synthase (glutamine-hydrolyzing) n=1 Tax=Sinorhizobium psoraleae TaxID=520838 RepID=A0ABT4KNR9_9HYPH|nr:hypothetical protein [Sinorhizobium psoraleae]MCZ4093623.1 hypothetical protein [Sinorhizobium psoraleae]